MGLLGLNFVDVESKGVCIQACMASSSHWDGMGDHEISPLLLLASM